MTGTPSAGNAPDASRVDHPAAPHATIRSFRVRIAALFSSVVAVILGVAPHVLHHAGPLAGAALLAGTGGTLIFGVIGLVLSVPFLLRMHRKSGGWTLPAGLLVVFAVGFSVSAFWIGPAISGGENDAKPARERAAPRAPETQQQGEHPAHHK